MLSFRRLNIWDFLQSEIDGFMDIVSLPLVEKD
jgi:hypothetical protein